MKYFNIFFLLISILFTVNVNSQVISTSESTEVYREGKLNSIIIDVPFVDTRLVETQLRDEMRDWEGKASVSKGEFIVKEGEIRTLGGEPFNAVAKILSEKNNIVRVALAIQIGDVYLSSSAHPEKFEAMSGRMQIFALRCSKLGIEDREEEAERDLVSFERDQKTLESRKESLEESIVNYEKKITDAKAKIVENMKEQKEKKASIEKQKVVVTDIKKKKESLQD